MKKMKSSTSQQLRKVRSSKSLVKRTWLRIKKRPVMAVLATVFVFALFGVGVYQLFAATNSQMANVESNVKAEKVVKNTNKKEEASVDSIVQSSPTPAPAASTPQPQPQPQSAAKNDDSAYKNNVNYNPNCRGAGCATPNPTYSILAPKAITVTAGSYVGPFTASTSSGIAVNWTGPQYDNEVGPYGYAMSSNDMRNTPTFPFYIRAESNVAPGNYTLRLGANHSATQSIVKMTITVTVLPAPATPSTPSYAMPR